MKFRLRNFCNMLFVSSSWTVSFIIRLFSTSAFRVPMRIICLVNNNQEYFAFMVKIVAYLVFPSFSKNLLLCRTNHYVFEAQRKLLRSPEQRISSGVTSRACSCFIFVYKFRLHRNIISRSTKEF